MLEPINRPSAEGLLLIRGPSIGSSTNIQSDLPRNKRKLQEGQIQAVPKVFFERLKISCPTAPCWSALDRTLADDSVQECVPNACQIFILDCYGFRSPIKLGTNTANGSFHCHSDIVGSTPQRTCLFSPGRQVPSFEKIKNFDPQNCSAPLPLRR